MSLHERDRGATFDALPENAVTAVARTTAERGDETVSASSSWLFVSPYIGGNGFRASIRGHLLELADPDSMHGLAPTPEDLLAAGIASDIAWFARRFLRDHGLEDYVSVSASRRTSQSPPILSGVDVTVEVSKDSAAISATLVAALERRFAARSLMQPHFQVRSA